MSNGVNLNFGDNENNVGRPTASAPQPAKAPIEPSSNRAYSPFNYGQGMGLSTFGQAIHADAGSEQFNKAYELMTKMVTDAKIDARIDVMPFPREVHKTLSYSVIVVTRNNAVPLSQGLAQQNYVTSQVLIVEASGETLQPYTDNRDSRYPYQVTMTTENTFNKLLVKYLTEAMASKYPGAAIKFIDPVVLPREMNIDEPNFIRRLMDASVIAVETRAQVRVPGFQDFNFVRQLGGDNMVLPVSADVTSQTVKDLTDRVFHADATVTVSVEQQGSRNNGAPVLNGAQDSRVISRTMVGIDLVPVDPELLEENRIKGRRNSRDFIPEVAWAPRLNARLLDQYFTRTPSGIMFAVASMVELARDRAWAQSYVQTRGSAKKRVDLRNIGFLNIEANLGSDGGERYGKPVETSASDFDDRAMGVFLDNTVTRSPILSVDCLTTGVQAYTTTGLFLAARGTAEEASRAHAELMHSMNCATDGELAKIIDLDTPLVMGEGELVHVGFWYDDNNEQRDLFELDNYLAMAVVGGTNNPSLAQDWVATYLNRREPEEKRKSERLTLLKAASNGAVKVTGTALRVEINGEVADAFVKAMGRAKLPLVPRSGEGDLFSTNRNIRQDAGRALYRGDGFGSRSVREDRGGSGGRYSANRY